MVLTTYHTSDAAMRLTNMVKVTSRPVPLPSIIACSRETTPIPNRNPMVIPTYTMVRIFILMSLASSVHGYISSRQAGDASIL